MYYRSLYVPDMNFHYVTRLNCLLTDFVQLGFLPRNIAKWVSPLWDIGFFKFVGYVYRDEVLGAASSRSNEKVQLMLHVLQAWYSSYAYEILCINGVWIHLKISRILQGVSISDVSKLIQPNHVVALCSLIASVQRCSGIWRLQEVSLIINKTNESSFQTLEF